MRHKNIPFLPPEKIPSRPTRIHAFGWGAFLIFKLKYNQECTSQQILDTNHKKIYNKKLSVSQISVRNATCDIELASDSLTNKLDAVITYNKLRKFNSKR